MRLTLVRHAQSVTNESNTVGGKTDPGLSAIGEQQCDHLAAHRERFRDARIIVSDLRRTTDTFHRVLGPERSATFDSRWRERNFGSAVRLTVEDARNRYPSMFAHEGRVVFDAKTEDGESWADVDVRVAEALEEILESGDDHVAVFTHGGPMTLVMCRVLGLNPETHMWRFIVENTAIATFIKSPWDLDVSGWNDVSHLPTELRTGGT